MKRFISVALLTALLAGCAHDSPCVPVYDDQGRLVHTNTCMKGTTQDNWETAGAIGGYLCSNKITLKREHLPALWLFPSNFRYAFALINI